jgi:hypothetical protein
MGNKSKLQSDDLLRVAVYLGILYPPCKGILLLRPWAARPLLINLVYEKLISFRLVGLVARLHFVEKVFPLFGVI